jgi:hypothetical protein
VTRSVLIIFLLLAAAPAWAIWSAIGENEDHTIYVDRGTLRIDGNLRRIWVLQNFKIQRAGREARSIRLLQQVDCKEGRVRILSGSAHSEPMAMGDVLRTISAAGDWEYAAPDTAAALVSDSVCPKRSK